MTYPPRGIRPWDTLLKKYVDDGVIAAALDATLKADAAQAAAEAHADIAVADEATARDVAIALQHTNDSTEFVPMPVPGDPANSVPTKQIDGSISYDIPSSVPSGTAGGDLSGTYPNPGVAKLNGTSLAGLGTGLLKNTTGTGVPSIAGAADVPVVAAGGTGPLSAGDASVTNSRAPSGSASGDLSGTYPSPGVAKLNGTSLAGLGTGLLKNTTGTGVPSIADAADVPVVAAGGTGPLSAGDASVTNSRAPNGSAGGDLSGTYPNPTLARRVIWEAGDTGYLSWSYDPGTSGGAVLMGTGGTLQMVRVHVPKACTITNLYIYVTTGGGTLTANQCLAALFNSSLGLLSATGNQATAWAGTGLMTMPLSIAQAITADDYFVGFFWNGSTAPTLLRGNNTPTAAALNHGGVIRVGTSSAGRTTTMPNPAAALTGSGSLFWVGLD